MERNALPILAYQRLSNHIQFRLFCDAQFQVVALIGSLLVGACLLTNPIWDFDFWWHLASGKFFFTEKHFLKQDIFTYTTNYSGIPMDRWVTINGYWLAQLGMYLAYLSAGFYGIIAFRLLVFFSIFSLVFFVGMKKEAISGSMSILLLLAIWFSQQFTADRPVLFSFLFSTALLFCVEYFQTQQQNKRSTLGIAACSLFIMLIWANCHRGFPIGPVLVSIYFLGQCLYLFIKPDSVGGRQGVGKLFLLVVSLWLVSLVNPNTFWPYLALIRQSGSDLEKVTIEYIPSWKLISQAPAVIWPFWFYSFVTGLSILYSWQRVRAGTILLTIFLFVIGVMGFRYTPFLLYATLPQTALNINEYIRGLPKSHFFLIENFCRFFFCILVLIIAGWAVMSGKFTQTAKSSIAIGRFPVNATQYVKNNHLPNNLYNYFEWGGYLGWELSPERKVFIDGRTLNLEILNDSLYMLWDLPQARELLRKYAIRTIIIPPYDTMTGEKFTIVNYLSRNQAWKLQYQDAISMVFVRLPYAQQEDDVSRKQTMSPRRKEFR